MKEDEEKKAEMQGRINSFNNKFNGEISSGLTLK